MVGCWSPWDEKIGVQAFLQHDGDDPYNNQHGDNDYYGNSPHDDGAAANDPYYSTNKDGADYDPNDPYHNGTRDGDDDPQQQQPAPYYDHTTGAYSDDPNAPLQSNRDDPYLNNHGQQPYSDDPNGTRETEMDEPVGPSHNQKKKKGAKSCLKKYCAGCYTPTCDFRGPWCVFGGVCCW